MAEFIKREAVLARAKTLHETQYGTGTRTLIDVSAVRASDIEDIPPADVVEVVRCKDCRYFHNGYDEKCCINHKGVVVTDENGFCHHAERRADNGNL